MLHSIDKIEEALRSGEMSLDEAEKQVSMHAKRISDIEVDGTVITPLPTGFPTLEDLMCFKKGVGDLIIVGARPGHGKSAFMFQLGLAVSQELPVLAFSLEMDKEQILTRFIAQKLGKSATLIQKGKVPKADIDKAKKELDTSQLYIDDRSRMHINQVHAACLDFAKHHKPGLIIIDYLQLIKSDHKGIRDQEIGEITAELKAIAKEMGCPVMVASQLNRSVDYRGKELEIKGKKPDYRPTLSDLRESGHIEADADVVLLISREYVYNQRRSGEADIGIAKNRAGAQGYFIFKFAESMTKFIDPYYTEV